MGRVSSSITLQEPKKYYLKGVTLWDAFMGSQGSLHSVPLDTNRVPSDIEEITGLDMTHLPFFNSHFPTYLFVEP